MEAEKAKFLTKTHYCHYFTSNLGQPDGGGQPSNHGTSSFQRQLCPPSHRHKEILVLKFVGKRRHENSVVQILHSDTPGENLNQQMVNDDNQGNKYRRIA